MDRIIRALCALLQEQTEVSTSPLYGVMRVIYGDPVKIPESDLPCLTVSPVLTEYQARGNKLDQKLHRLEIRLVYNARAFFEKDTEEDDSNKVHAVQDVVQKMEKNGTGLSTAVTSVAGIIESNPSLPLAGVATASLSKVVSVNYEGLKTARGFHTYESVLTAEVIAVGDRS